MIEWSEAQILGAISAAIRADDLPAAVALLHILALKNPRTAQTILDAIEALR